MEESGATEGHSTRSPWRVEALHCDGSHADHIAIAHVERATRHSILFPSHDLDPRNHSRNGSVAAGMIKVLVRCEDLGDSDVLCLGRLDYLRSKGCTEKLCVVHDSLTQHTLTPSSRCERNKYE